MNRYVLPAIALYLAFAGLFVALVDGATLGEPVAGYRLSVFWLMPETSADRLGALAAAGRATDGWVYLGIERLSFALLACLAALGAGLALTQARARILPRRELIVVVVGFVVLAGLAHEMSALTRMLEASGARIEPGLAAMPGYWIGTTLVSCAVMSRYAALLAHDAVSWLRDTLLRRADAAEAPPPTA